MKIRLCFSAVTALWLMAMLSPSFASTLSFGDLAFRATVGSMQGSAAYVSITNKGAEDEFLLAAESNLARKTELHMMVMEDGVMRMRQIDSGIRIPAGETLHLAPGGFHIMLIGLTSALTAGARFSLELLFEKAGTVTLDGVALRPAEISKMKRPATKPAQ
jgi:copper(I)-binding protein